MSRKGENIYLRKDGRWEGRYPKGRANGRLRFGYVFGRTYREAKEKLLAAKLSCPQETEDEKRQRSGTLGAISALWLQESTHFLKESTVAKYHEYLDYYILPKLGDMPMESITSEDAEALLRRLMNTGGNDGKGLAAQTISTILNILQRIKEHALRLGYAANFSVESLKVKRRHKTLRVFSGEEWKKLKSYLEASPSPCHAGILLAMLTGIRIGELCALGWNDVSLTMRQLHIHQTLQRIRDVSGENTRTKIIITSPKSESANRIIPLPDLLCEYLAPIRKAGTCLLTCDEKKFIEPNTMERRFKAVLKKCGLPPATFHVLRHTFATRCVEAGVDPKCLSVILGHADVSVTFNRYVHPTMETKRRNMRKFMETVM